MVQALYIEVQCHGGGHQRNPQSGFVQRYYSGAMVTD